MVWSQIITDSVVWMNSKREREAIGPECESRDESELQPPRVDWIWFGPSRHARDAADAERTRTAGCVETAWDDG
jgi:hypothetical protein